VPSQPAIILFDGVCNLCNGFVQFLLPRDRHGKFRFGSLQSESARQLLKDSGLNPATLSTVVLVEGSQVYTESTAVLRIVRKLGAGWPLLFAFIVIPPFLRNAIYRFIAGHRYRLFGKREQCMLPSPEWQDRFID